MRYEITLTTDNAAFSPRPAAEVARILRELAARLENSNTLDAHTLKDSNGNTVGEAGRTDNEDTPTGETVRYAQKDYTLTGDAHLSNRVFPGCYQQAEEGEEYISEWQAYATDEEGNQYKVVWQFEVVKGEEPETDDGYPWGDDYITDVDPY